MRMEDCLQTVQAMEKTLELLELLAAGNDRLSIGRIADKLFVSRKQALFLLVTMESRGLVRWDHQARLYRPGRKTIDLMRTLAVMPGVPAIKPAPRAAKSRSAAVRGLRKERRSDQGLAAAR